MRRYPKDPCQIASLRFRLAGALGAALVLFGFSAVTAHAGVPDPRYCEADTCLLLSPAGTFLYRVVLRDESFAPVPGAPVVLDFTTASGIQLCSTADPDSDRRIRGDSDNAGVIEFRVKGGGQSAGYVVVSAVGQTLRLAYPRSTDLSGDLIVSQADVTLHASLPTNSRAGDLDCDGDSDAADRQLIQNQLGHDCQTVGVLPSTWGRIKALFR